MTIYLDTHDAIHEAVKAFATAQGIACAYPNADFTPPRTASGRSGAWMRLHIVEGSVAKEVILAGTAEGTYRAAFILSFFVPLQSGTARLSELAQAALTSFPEGGDIGDAVVERTALVSAPSVDGWSQVNVSFYFRAD